LAESSEDSQMPRWAEKEDASTDPLRAAHRGAHDRRRLHPAWGLLVGVGALAIIAFVATSGGSQGAASGLTLPEAREDATTVAGAAPEATASPATPRAPAHAAPRLPGATVKGTVRWGTGQPLFGAEIALLDTGGAVVGEVEIGDDGHYLIADPALAGVELRVTESLTGAHRRDLTPLRAGETRSFDIVIGGVREVVGWVLDPGGDPLPGIFVALSWEAAGSRWHAVSDAGGGFIFADVPETSLRVTADGGDLGMASARVAQSDAPRREVTLVLEPTGTILVSAAPEVAALGEVTIRCYSAGAHGEDGLWNDDLRATVYEGEHEVYDLEDVYDPYAHTVEGASDEEIGAMLFEPVEPDPSLVQVEEMISSALRGWDVSDPEGSLVRMATDLARMDPRMEQEIRSDVERAFPELVGQPLEAIARAAAHKVIAEEPQLLDMMGLAAAHLQGGMPPFEAFMRAEQDLRQVEPPPPLPEPALVDPALAEPWVTIEPDYGGADSLASDPAVHDMYAEIDSADDVPALDFADYPDHAPEYEENIALMERLEALREELGFDDVELADEPRSLVATGPFFQPIPVRGAFEYRVSVRHPDGFELVCGTVFVAAGDEVEVHCGGSGPAVLEGRVVNSRGVPIEGAQVEVFPDIYSDSVRATTDRLGRYVLEVPVARAQLVTVFADSPAPFDDSHWIAQRRQQNARPGVRTEVPDIILRTRDELVDFTSREPFGGVGASIALGTEGIVLQTLFEDGPLALSGAEEGDVIVRIGEEIGASLSADDAVLLLRGEVGSEIDLTLRSAAGELYELLLTRGLVTPVTWPEVD
jgi:hypothetical protein